MLGTCFTNMSAEAIRREEYRAQSIHPLGSLSEMVDTKKEKLHVRRGKFISAIAMAFDVDPMLIAQINNLDLISPGKMRLRELGGANMNYAQWITSTEDLMETVLSFLFGSTAAVNRLDTWQHDVETIARLRTFYARFTEENSASRYFRECSERLWLVKKPLSELESECFDEAIHAVDLFQRN